MRGVVEHERVGGEDLGLGGRAAVRERVARRAEVVAHRGAGGLEPRALLGGRALGRLGDLGLDRGDPLRGPDRDAGGRGRAGQPRAGRGRGCGCGRVAGGRRRRRFPAARRGVRTGRRRLLGRVAEVVVRERLQRGEHRVRLRSARGHEQLVPLAHAEHGERGQAARVGGSGPARRVAHLHARVGERGDRLHEPPRRAGVEAEPVRDPQAQLDPVAAGGGRAAPRRSAAVALALLPQLRGLHGQRAARLAGDLVERRRRRAPAPPPPPRPRPAAPR